MQYHIAENQKRIFSKHVLVESTGGQEGPENEYRKGESERGVNGRG